MALHFRRTLVNEETLVNEGALVKPGNVMIQISKSVTTTPILLQRQVDNYKNPLKVCLLIVHDIPTAMLPLRRKKADLSKLPEEGQSPFRHYDQLPTRKNMMQKKYLDSGDYALSKARRASAPVGRSHASPKTHIPHSSPVTTHGSSVRDSSLVQSAVRNAESMTNNRSTTAAPKDYKC